MSNTKREDAGLLLADTLRQFLYDLKVEDGLSAVGYTKDDIPDLVRGTIPQVTTHYKCFTLDVQDMFFHALMKTIEPRCW